MYGELLSMKTKFSQTTEKLTKHAFEIIAGDNDYFEVQDLGRARQDNPELFEWID